MSFQRSILVQVTLQIFVHVFQEKVTSLVGQEHIVQFDDIRMIQLLENGRFAHRRGRDPIGFVFISDLFQGVDFACDAVAHAKHVAVGT